MEAALPLSSQKLETYTSCPFDFFMRFILSVRDEEAVEEELDVEPRELGLINHRILSRLLPILVEKGFFGEPGVDTELLDSLVGAHVKKETSRRLSGRIPALILRAREQHTARIMGRLIRRERDAVMPGSIPTLYEVTFGPGAEGSPEGKELTLTIGPHTIDFAGRIDRIDVNRAEATFTVIDYKKKKPSAARKLKTEILNGRHFQLPIYLMAADAFVPPETGRPGGGALVYLEADDEADHRETLSREEYEETRGAVVEHIGAVVDAVIAGAFTPSRGTLCRFCAHRDLCRSDIKAVDTVRRQRSNGGRARSEREGEDDDA
jgi:ATP-dependent helicase/DNAse subunit B